MLSEKEITNARKNFELAAKEFGFVFHSPFVLTDTLAAFGFIEHYGSRNGAVVCLSDPFGSADEEIVEWCEKHACFCSFLNVKLLQGEYDASYFQEMLQDWGHFE